MSLKKNQLAIAFLKEWNDWEETFLFHPVLVFVEKIGTDKIFVQPLTEADTVTDGTMEHLEIAPESVLSFEAFHCYMTTLYCRLAERKSWYETMLKELKALSAKDLSFHRITRDDVVYYRPCFPLPASRNLFVRTMHDESLKVVASAGLSIGNALNLVDEPYDFVRSGDLISRSAFEEEE